MRGIVFAPLAIALACSAVAFAQAPPPSYPPQELDRLVSRIALYPDPLLSQIFAASTFPDQIPDAARWADEHRYLTGDAFARAISDDRLPWDPSVQALLPFPSVLGMMASDMGWTTDLGNAFLAQPPELMDAVQRERHKAYDYGYLRTSPQIVAGATIASCGTTIACSSTTRAGIAPGSIAAPTYILMPRFRATLLHVRPSVTSCTSAPNASAKRRVQAANAWKSTVGTSTAKSF